MHPGKSRVTSRAKKLFAFFERGEVPPDMAEEFENAITAIKTQPRNLLKHPPRKAKNNSKS